MHLKKAFTKPVRNGQVTYNTRPMVPLPVKVRSVTIRVDNGERFGRLNYAVTSNEQPVASGTAASGEEILFDPPLRVGAGQQFFQIVASSFDGVKEISGEIEAQISIF